MGGIGALVAAIFGIIWTIAVFSMGAPFFFCLFGVVFVLAGVGSAIYSFKNATGENRYSAFDVVDHNEEPDPLNARYGSGYSVEHSSGIHDSFCPYCGQPVQGDHKFCKKCGKKL